MQELFSYAGIPSDHIASRTSRYIDDAQHSAKEVIDVHSISYIVKNTNAEDKMIIVDDTYDTGLSVEEVKKKLRMRCRKNMPHDVRTAVIFYKPDNLAEGVEPPHYYLFETDKWIVYPWEIKDMTPEIMEEILGAEVREICERNRDRYTLLAGK